MQEIALGLQEKFFLGNLDAKRDWWTCQRLCADDVDDTPMDGKIIEDWVQAIHFVLRPLQLESLLELVLQRWD